MMSTWIRRLLPHPILTVLLTLIWNLLANSLSLNSLVMGLILGVLIPFITAAYWPERPRINRPFRLLSYILLVIWDILIANVIVAWTILTKSNDAIQSTWISIPLDLKRPEAITILAGTITLTPGTVSADLSDRGHALLVHALDAGDPDAVRDEIKERYERRLKEIFE